VSTLPRKIIANHSEEEKRDRPEQRLKLKIGSFFIKTKLVRRSENTLTKNIANPKDVPTINPLEEGNSGKTTSIPPNKHAPKSKSIIALPDGKENNDE